MSEMLLPIKTVDRLMKIVDTPQACAIWDGMCNLAAEYNTIQGENESKDV